MKPFEKAVQHLQAISSPFNLDLDVLRDGFVDLQARLHALEAQARSAAVPLSSTNPGPKESP